MAAKYMKHNLVYVALSLGQYKAPINTNMTLLCDVFSAIWSTDSVVTSFLQNGRVIIVDFARKSIDMITSEMVYGNHNI